MLQSPEHMFRAIATKAHIDSLAMCVKRPARSPGRVLPALRDGVADEDQLDILASASPSLVACRRVFHHASSPRVVGITAELTW